jgi:phosphatidate cytidylyltransferase
MAINNTHLQRWLTGLALGMTLLAIILLSSPFVLTLVAILAILVGITEYNSMVFGDGFKKEKTESILFAILIPLAALHGDPQVMTSLIVFAFISVFIIFLWNIREDRFDVSSVAKVVFGMMYIPLLTSHFILLRKLDQGAFWIILVLVISIVGDTVALYVGKNLGKRKLLEPVSPGKTVEGTLGLMAGGTLGAWIFGYFFLPHVSMIHLLILGLVGGVIGQLGDLCESAIKRNYGKKDASALLPGHGGLLDRLDSLIFVAPFVYYYRIFVIGG